MAGGEEDENMTAVEAGVDSSDDDIEIVPKSVDNYWLEHGDETPVSFATLPYFKRGEDVSPDKVVYVRGTQDNGMRLYMRAMSWELELTKDIKPVFRLKTEKYWIQLLKPRKSYEETIRSIMSVAQFMNFALMNPDASEKAVWSHVKDVFLSWEVSPSRNDLSAHLLVVRHIVASDEKLSAAAALQTLDLGVSKKRPASLTEDQGQISRKGMNVSDEEGEGVEGEGQREQKRGKFELGDLNPEEEMDGYGQGTEEEAGDLSETVCCICDNGGTVTCCDGPCMRSFHLNKGAGGADDSHCSTLGYSKAEAERTDNFFCPNCKAKIHQCYACGKLGSSDESAGDGQEVFVCDAAMCGHFYHPKCIAVLILRDKDESEQDALAESIKERKGFVCTMHKCWKCGKGEEKNEKDLQFGVCRRCPRVWHRKCLPFAPPADDSESEDDDDEPQRAWDDLLPNRLLVYCKRHMIIEKLGTPARTHVKFPPGFLPVVKIKKVLTKSRSEEQERKGKLLKLLSKKDTVKSGVGLKALKADHTKKLKQTSTVGQGRLVKKSKLVGDSSAAGTAMAKSGDKSSGVFVIKGRPGMQRQDFSSLEDLQKPSKSLSVSKARMDSDVKLERSNSMLARSAISTESASQQKSKPPVAKAMVVDGRTKSMVTDLIERHKAFVTVESVLKKQNIPLCYRRHTKTPDKKYSLFKIESITKGMRKALETLETGGTIEDAKAKCSPDLIRFIELCRNDLRVYLSPFLHGARYTSYGRHFTKSEKLEEIVDRLHWYVEPGDMLVDFCCGANEFSLFTRRKLEESGKKCDYKNFDLIQTKNDFNFQKRDWFQVTPDELPNGDRLIMGLNPPFGVKGHLANQFIDHAIRFRPKLIILIVPKETERLDCKHDSYNLIWEDLDLLSGYSFYLPGSVDKHQKPLNDWNVVPPPLYLWSRPDWTPKHMAIASDKGHITTFSGSRFVGCPWKAPARPLSPSSLLDPVEDDDEAPMELEEKKEEMDKSYQMPEQHRIADKPTEVQETGIKLEPKLDRSSSDKLKAQKSRVEPSDLKVGDSSTSMLDARVEDKVPKGSEAKAHAKKDGSAVGNQAGRLPEPRKKIPEGSQANQRNMKATKTAEPPKRKSYEGQGHVPQRKEMKSSYEGQGHVSQRKEKKSYEGQGHVPQRKENKSYEVQGHASQRKENSKPSSQESPEVTRRHSETRHDSYRKDRQSNDWYDRGDDAQADPMRDPMRDAHWKKAPEKLLQSGDANMGGRRSPSRHDKYEPGRRNSPDKYDRYGASRHGEDRKASPERSRRSTTGSEPRRRSPDNPRQSSSVVDLGAMFSSSEAKSDPPRGYDDLLARKSTGMGYNDSSYYRGSSPIRRQTAEDSSRTWVNMDSYQQGGSETYPRTNDTSFIANSYDAAPSYRVQHAEAQLNTLSGAAYAERDAFTGRRPDPYGVQHVSRHTDLYQSDLGRAVPGLSSVNYRDDRYGAPMQTEDHFRAGAPAGGVGVLPERSYQPTWPGTVPPAPAAYNSVYGAEVPQQTRIDPSLLASRGLYDDRLNQHSRPQYPSQGRLSGQGNQQSFGGWFND